MNDQTMARVQRQLDELTVTLGRTQDDLAAALAREKIKDAALLLAEQALLDAQAALDRCQNEQPERRAA